MTATRACVVDGCTGRHLARGFCRAHYVRWQRHGSPLAEQPVRPRATDQVTYAAVRRLVVAARGPAAEQLCAGCRGAAAVWSYDVGAADERTEPGRGRRFSTDVNRYTPRCRPCHRRVIAARGVVGRRACGAGGLDAERAVRLYRAGATARGIGSLMGVGTTAVLAALRANGVDIRPAHRPRTAAK